MSYQAPLQDIRFVIEKLAGLEEVQRLPGFEEATSELVDAVLNENARFVEGVMAPLNRVGDEQPAVWNDGAVTTSPGFKDAYRQFAEGGWQGLQHPVDFGGQGLPKLVGAPCIENMNAANLAFSLCPLLTDGVIEALLTAGSDEQKARYLPKLVEGTWTGTMNLTEPQAGSDLAQVRTRAVPQADGTYRIFGQKIFITWGEHDVAENIVHLVLARTPDAPPGVKGISLFIVPRRLVGEDGSLGQRNDVYCASLEHKLGIHGSPTAVLLYGEGKGEVGEGAIGYRVGEENRGLEYMFIMMNAARFAVGMQGVAVSERALQKAVRFAAERVQSRAIGSSKPADTIDQHPDVQRMLLTMRALTEGARATAYVAASLYDKAHHHADAEVRKRNQAAYEYLVPIVKGWSTEMSLEVTSLGVQVHGGMGFIEETGAAQYYRDARILPIYEGTTAIQANDLVGRKTVRDGGAVALGLIERMRETIAALEASGDEELGLVARRFTESVDDYEIVVNYVLETAGSDARAAYAGSVPYLQLAGIVHGGWHMARAALVCRKEHVGDAFHARKAATAAFYAMHILPRTHPLRLAITEGAQAVRWLVA
ncbi:acyl-CoA dehydrogenase [Verticiella sediminum]|uniref:3-methylmercaptopropionyl-CoA dehydrogenase n=1 Tax=Verticiella sediminum TaxID=1247510 RepID=A0A556ABE1_9BURK|nr:acyl-CoA dehydrogenase [Verticiella sediminum]TSH90205.1 acyl-CoA dehydrogenase [Verticiella sediminum]